MISASLAAATGCARDSGTAPAPSEADAPWQALVAELDGDRLTVHEKLRAVKEFALEHPSSPLDKRIGHRKLVAAYQAGLRTHDGSSDETSMLLFYDEFTTKHAVARHAGFEETWGVSIIVGFWMRRAADGTDGILVDFLRKVAADYDPELAKLL